MTASSTTVFQGQSSRWLLQVMALGLALRLLFAPLVGYRDDMTSYQSWALHLADQGISDFYSSATNYPPLFAYLYWPVGKLARVLGLELYDGAFNALIKLPNFVFEMLAVWVLFRWLASRSVEGARLTACLILFNPALIYDSAVWGQTDNLLASLLVLSLASAAGKARSSTVR